MSAPVRVIGAGPAGLMAAETLAGRGHRVVVHDRMPSVARKFLMAGRGGLNLTHAEGLEDRARFLSRYGDRSAAIAPWLSRFGSAALMAWAEGLGQPLFTGSSGRVFPRAMKASPLLRAWLARLKDQGVEVRTRSNWLGWRGPDLAFETPSGETVEPAAAVILAMGGASWPRLGSDGAWAEPIGGQGVSLVPFLPSNMGVDVAWSEVLTDRFAGQALKPVVLSHDGQTVRGEVILTRYGLEGGAIYALSAHLRDAIRAEGATTLTMDLRPDLTIEALAARLARPRGKDSVNNFLRKAGGLSATAIAVLREIGEPPPGAEKLARRIKGVRLRLSGVQGLDRAISSAGGVPFAEVDAALMLRARPGVFVAGEMLDWEAPTGGYLLTACMASGVVAGEGAADWLGSSPAADGAEV